MSDGDDPERSMDLAAFGDFVVRVGFPAAVAMVLLFHIYKLQINAWDRELRMANRITELEKNDAERIVPALERCAGVLTRVEARLEKRP